MKRSGYTKMAALGKALKEEIGESFSAQKINNYLASIGLMDEKGYTPKSWPYINIKFSKCGMWYYGFTTKLSLWELLVEAGADAINKAWDERTK